VSNLSSVPPNNGLKLPQDLASLDPRCLGLIRWADDTDEVVQISLLGDGDGDLRERRVFACQDGVDAASRGFTSGRPEIKG
jgi:hypothetical protein